MANIEPNVDIGSIYIYIYAQCSTGLLAQRTDELDIVYPERPSSVDGVYKHSPMLTCYFRVQQPP